MCDLEKNKEEKERESAQKMLQNAQIFFLGGCLRVFMVKFYPENAPKCPKNARKCSHLSIYTSLRGS